MAALTKAFVPTDHNTEQTDFEDLPAGILEFEIEASDVVETGPEHARTGSGMKYTANVRSPEELAGRKFFGFINLENANPEAQRIGQEEFAKLCRAIFGENVPAEVKDTEDLHLRAYTVKLGMGRPSKKVDADGRPLYPARMEVKKYFFPDQGPLPEPALDAVQPTPAATRPAAANNNQRQAANQNSSAAPARAAGARPWGKKA